ncbi:CotH kinase family protein [Psychromonas sp. GE-S-Ul-11]|uniref:CotH kinase family protein n=1 Tax=Psychromonas sp. GE-S-Ul-11 TaxID=3241170 RepID=UPI00390CAFEE
MMLIKHTLSYLKIMAIVLSLFSLIACTESDDSDSVTASSTDESDIVYSELDNTDDWSEATHEKLTTDEIIENIDVVFNTSEVQKLRIVIESENWTVMNDDLEELTEELNGSTDFSDLDNPIFVPSEVFYYSEEDDTWTEWYKVGVRFKGNSSLYNAGNSKLPFKLDFDEFEDEYPEIKNQRFYGFKQLNLKNNYDDQSEMHEVVANDIFRDFGLASAHSTFYALYLNVDGSGDEENDIYYGLYTLVEEVDDTVIETQYYDNDDGNLYKPEDDAATFASGTYDEDEYGLKTDDDETYEDIAALYDVINDSSRTSSDDEAWQASLEAVFDVDTFLKWLAANSVMQNWDTYGVMPHNFFLYHNPDTGTFEWIPWDNNEALVDNNRALSITMTSVDEDEWPLIGYILDQATYEAQYQTYLETFAKSYFNSDSSSEYNINDEFTTFQSLIEDYVASEGNDYTFTSEEEFEEAVETLIEHTSDRYDSAQRYIGW